jgi:hypothetical protein
MDLNQHSEGILPEDKPRTCAGDAEFRRRLDPRRLQGISRRRRSRSTVGF